MSSPSPLWTTDAIEHRVRELGPWFHNMNLAGVQTAPEHFLGDYPRIKWLRFADAIPMDLRGKSVLDIGCNAGFYSIEMKRRGARHVLGIDFDDDYLAQARFAAEICGVDIELRQMSVYQLGEIADKFDVVLFMGVFYHLRHPLLALDLIHAHAAKDLMVFQSMLRGSEDVAALDGDYPFAETEMFDRAEFPRMHFIERRYAGDNTNWWIPNRACVEAMLRSAGFRVLARPEAEVFVCRREQLEETP